MQAFASPIRFAKEWYERHERPISSLFLIGGFILDTITLGRVDAAFGNIWIGLHLVAVASIIVYLNRSTGKEFWLTNILQLLFGNLLSAFLVFYFRGATLSVTWPFILILFSVLIANESLRKHYERLVFQISYFFFSLLAFTIFVVPIVVHRIGPEIFVLSAGISLALMLGFLRVLRRASRDSFERERKTLISVITIMFITVSTLYFTNLIPPLPLSLKEAGVYHSIGRTTEGNYEVGYEDTKWYSFFKRYNDFHIAPGGSVFAYSAVFSPSGLNLSIVHEWQHYNDATGEWMTLSKITLPVLGGRNGGFRTYSEGFNLEPGKWRVNVKTSRGEVVGRLSFNLVEVGATPIQKTKVNK